MRTSSSITRLAWRGLLLALLVLASSGLASADRLKIVATIPDLGDVIRRIGGDEVEVDVIARGTHNLHAVPIKPSHIIATSRADAFFQIGLALEHSWVPALLQASRNKRIDPGKPGFVNVSEGWEAINVPLTTSRRQGADVHPFGNPHINLDPAAGVHMADRVLAALERLRPERAEDFRGRHAAFVAEIERARARWSELAEALARKKVVVYHLEFPYLLRAYGIETVATLEPKPGVPPTPSHLADVAQAMKQQDVEVILTAKWSNNSQVAGLAERSGARVVELPTMVIDDREDADTWIEMMDFCLERLRAAFDVDERG